MRVGPKLSLIILFISIIFITAKETQKFVTLKLIEKKKRIQEMHVTYKSNCNKFSRFFCCQVNISSVFSCI